MNNSLSFALTLHRVFDSVPPGAGADFYSGGRRIYPIKKTGGLYVFLNDESMPVTVTCGGFLPASAIAAKGRATPVALYPGDMFCPPPSWRSLRGRGEPDTLMYCADGRFDIKLVEHDAEKGIARIRSRRGFTGGCLLFEKENKRELALILEKRSPDIFYVSGLSEDYAGQSVRRVYCAKTGSDGTYHLVIPADFEPETIEYAE